MSLLTLLVAAVPDLAKKGTRSATQRNALRHPVVTPAVGHGVLTHPSAGAVTDRTPPDRVSIFLGPGVTFEGIADTLMPLYDAAKAGGGPNPPTVEELAKAIVAYNTARLPTSDWSGHQVGLRLTLPVEVAANGDWVVNADKVREWAKPPFFNVAWTAKLTTPPAPLGLPDPYELEGAAVVIALAPLSTLAPALWASALRNPFEAVFQIFAVLRALEAQAAGNAAQAALAMLDGATGQQADLLAGTSAGNGILRRLSALLPVAPAGADPAKFTKARTLLDAALFDASVTGITLVSHRELPQSPDQRKAQSGEAEPTAGSATDPVGGVHRLVLGRDLAVGRNLPRDSTGHAFAGRLVAAPTVLADATHHNPGVGVPRTADLLAILSGGRKHARLDAVDARGPAPLTVGLDRWSALVPDELPSLLLALKKQAADEFDLFFALHRLDVDEPDPLANPGRGGLRRINDDGLTSTPMDEAAIRTFLGATTAGGRVTIAPSWAARFRLAALVSRSYRRAQVTQALTKLKREASVPHIDDQLVTPTPKIAVTIDGREPLPAPAVGMTFHEVDSFRDLTTARAVVSRNSTGKWGTHGKVYLDHGKLLVDPDDATKFVVPTRMRIVHPEAPGRPGVVAGTGKLPVVVIVHGNHFAYDPIYGPPVGTATVTLPNGTTAVVPFADTAVSVTDVGNHEGYGRLQDLLATLGIVSVSVNTNAANSFDTGIAMRANTVLAALKDLKRRNADPASRYRGRLDLKNLGLMGHSRGGDVVVDLAKKLKGHADFKVKTVCSLAPTDFTGTATDATQLRLARDDVAFYLVVYGSLDGDVSGLEGAESFTGTGFRLYDRARCPKAMVQLSECCHNRFNSVWSNGTAPVPADPLLKFRVDDGDLTAADAARLRSFDQHQKLEVEYVGGLFRWQLLGHEGVSDLFDGTRANSVGIPASLQWSFGSKVLALDDLENATPSLPGATRAFSMGGRVPFAAIQVPESTLTSPGSATLVPITKHVTHPSQVLHVDATVSTVGAEAMHLDIPAGSADWRAYTVLTFRISSTLDISDVGKHGTSPLPRATLVLTDTSDRSHRMANALAFSIGVPAAPEFHLLDLPVPDNNATLFRFETVRVPIVELARSGVDRAKVRRLAVEFDQTNHTHVLFDSFQLVKA